MRILYMPLGYGSATVLSHEIISRLAKHNDVVVIPSNTYGEGNASPRVVGGLSTGLASIFPVRHLTEGIKVARRFDPDVIISQYHPQDMISYVARMISGSLGKPMIARSDDVWFVPFKRLSFLSSAIHRLNCSVVGKSKFFLVNSAEHRLIIERVYGRREGVVIHPNGVDTVRFNPFLTGLDVKRKLGLEDKEVVLFYGSAAWFYGLDLLPKAFALVAKEVKDARLLLVGMLGDAGYRDFLLAEVSRLGIEKKTIIQLPVSYERIHEFTASGDVCIGTLYSSPVTIGTIPTKVLQYMSCGKPTIVKKYGVSSDLVIHNKTGIIFDGTIQDLANWITTLLQDKNYAKRIGKEARNHVEKNHDWNILVSQLEELVSHAN
jgi:glycosyltransferase involved in cell wall biosynthesis